MLAIKKINKVEREKLSIEEMIYTEWINLKELSEKEICFLESLNITKLSTNNLFKLYEGYINSINSLNLSRYKEEFEIKSTEGTLNDMKLLEKIEKLQSEITSLRNKLKKESNLGTRVEINVKIKKLKRKIEEIESTLN